MLRIGFAGVAHMHSYGYAAGLKGKAAIVGVWDPTPALADKFAETYGLDVYGELERLVETCDALIVTSENNRHLEIMQRIPHKPILCEKPIVTTEADAAALLDLVDGGAKIMTAFPCRYSPAFTSLKSKVANGEIGDIVAVCATNRGSCPFEWFVDTDLSGGGAMIDHVVHVTDLLRVLLGSEVSKVQAQIGHNMYHQNWEDTAMVTLEFENGVFATLDSSWSRHASYKTWGDVTMSIVGTNGVIELDMFGQELDVYRDPKHSVAGFGSNIDAGLVADFLKFASGDGPPPISAFDGIQAARVAIAGYKSVQTRDVVEVAA